MDVSIPFREFNRFHTWFGRREGSRFRCFNPFQGHERSHVSIPFREFNRFHLPYDVWREIDQTVFQSLSGNSIVSTRVLAGISIPRFSVSIPFREFNRFHDGEIVLFGGSLDGFNPFQGIQSFPLLYLMLRYALPGWVSIPFREFNRFHLHLRNPQKRRMFPGFNPFQGIQSFPLAPQWLFSARKSRVSIPFREFNRFHRLLEWILVSIIYGFQSLSGNSIVSTWMEDVLMLVHHRQFQSLSGNSIVSTHGREVNGMLARNVSIPFREFNRFHRRGLRVVQHQDFDVSIPFREFNRFHIQIRS